MVVLFDYDLADIDKIVDDGPPFDGGRRTAPTLIGLQDRKRSVPPPALCVAADVAERGDGERDAATARERIDKSGGLIVRFWVTRFRRQQIGIVSQ
jgi:hypothetical protein